MIARVLCATAQSEQAAEAMAELWGEQVGRFERTAPGFQGAAGGGRGVLIDVPEAAQPPSAGDAYAVLVSRLDRRSWRVRVIDRASGVVARSEWFEDEAAARRRRDELSADAAALDAAAFRSRYRLP